MASYDRGLFVIHVASMESNTFRGHKIDNQHQSRQDAPQNTPSLQPFPISVHLGRQLKPRFDHASFLLVRQSGHRVVSYANSDRQSSCSQRISMQHSSLSIPVGTFWAAADRNCDRSATASHRGSRSRFQLIQRMPPKSVIHRRYGFLVSLFACCLRLREQRTPQDFKHRPDPYDVVQRATTKSSWAVSKSCVADLDSHSTKAYFSPVCLWYCLYYNEEDRTLPARLKRTQRHISSIVSRQSNRSHQVITIESNSSTTPFSKPLYVNSTCPLLQ